MATGEYTFPYVARWADGDLELVRQTAERVVACARKPVVDLGLLASDESIDSENERGAIGTPKFNDHQAGLVRGSFIRDEEHRAPSTWGGFELDDHPCSS